MSHAAMCSTPASRRPEAIACPASPNPMKQRRGLLLLIVKSVRKLALHALVKALDIDDHTGVGAVADALLVVEGLDAKLDRPSLDPGDGGGRPQAHSDRGRRIMPDIQVRAEALVAGRQQGLDRVQGCC